MLELRGLGGRKTESLASFHGVNYQKRWGDTEKYFDLQNRSSLLKLSSRKKEGKKERKKYIAGEKVKQGKNILPGYWIYYRDSSECSNLKIYSYICSAKWHLRMFSSIYYILLSGYCCKKFRIYVDTRTRKKVITI